MNIYELRKAILRDYQRFGRSAPAKPEELPAISTEPAIIRAGAEAVIEQGRLLVLHGFLEAVPGFGGEYLRITQKGAEELAVEFPHSPFVHGPGAV